MRKGVGLNMKITDALDIAHVEGNVHLHRQLDNIRKFGGSPSVALNPHTPAEMIENVLDLVDHVLVMTVNPGFGGQTYIPLVAKIEAVKQMVDAGGHDIDIEIDGGINAETITVLQEIGLPYAGQWLPPPFRLDSAFKESLNGLRSSVKFGMVDCEKVLPSNNKTLVAKLGLVRRAQLRLAVEDALLASMGRAVATPHGFAERMARFWRNHFAVAIKFRGHAPKYKLLAIKNYLPFTDWLIYLDPNVIVRNPHNWIEQ